MLRSSVFLILLTLIGCQHRKGDFFLTAPQKTSEPRITPIIVENSKPETIDVCTETEERAYCDAGIEDERTYHDAGVGMERTYHNTGIGTEEPLYEEVEIQANVPIKGMM